MPDNLPNRPRLFLPFHKGGTVIVKTYVGHNPDDRKQDMYLKGSYEGAPILACAPGLVHEEFYPGGIEINHGNGWFTTYMHMKDHVAPGTHVAQGQIIGHMGSVGTGYPHLHNEQLYAGPGSTDADNQDITYPLWQEQGPNASPLRLVPGHDLQFTSANGGPFVPTPVKRPIGPQPKPSPIKRVTRRRPKWVLPAGHYLGLSSGPKQSHSGHREFDSLERAMGIDPNAVRACITYVQQRMIELAPRMGRPTPPKGWADGFYDQPTADYVRAWQLKWWRKQTSLFGQVWVDDYGRL